MSEVDNVRSAANSLIKDCLQKIAMQEATRGFRLFGSPASVRMTANPDPGLVARTRVVVRAGVVTVEVLDPTRESFGEIFRSDTPDLVDVNAPASSVPAPEISSSGLEPVAGQWILKDGRLQTYQPGDE
jgi:hypothetical protein